MNRPSRFRLHFVGILPLWASLLTTSHGVSEHWVGSWYASPTPAVKSPITLPPGTMIPWCTKVPVPVVPPRFENATLRSVVHLTTGGQQVRLRFSNLYGDTALEIGAVQVALGTLERRISFRGRSEVSVLPGQSTVSDSVAIQVSAGDNLAVSAYYPRGIPRNITLHVNAAEANTLLRGNSTNLRMPSGNVTSLPYTYFLTAVDVENDSSPGTIVTVGDSITDGDSRRWPALLARRLSQDGKHFGVLNAGISGNRLLQDSHGPWGPILGQSAIARFERDVLEQPGVKYVVLYEGINDLGLGDFDGATLPATADLISAIRTIGDRAHRRGLRIYVATLAPFRGAVGLPRYYSQEKDLMRKQINDWIRTSSDIDGYFDFERALEDPTVPDRISPDLDSCDHLHPSDAGERALSEAVSLSAFQ